MVEKCPQRQTCGRLGASSIMCVLVLAVPAAATGQWLTVQPAWHACGCVQMLAGVSAFKRERDYFTMQQVLSFPHAFTLNFPNHVPGVAKVRFASSRHVVTWRRSHNGFLRYGPGPGVDVMLQDLVLSMLQPQPERRLGAGPKDSKLSFAALRVRTLVQCAVCIALNGVLLCSRPVLSLSCSATSSFANTVAHRRAYRMCRHVSSSRRRDHRHNGVAA